MSERQYLRRSSRLQKLKGQQLFDQSQQNVSGPLISLQTAIVPSIPSPNVPIVPIDSRLQPSQSDGSAETAPRRRKIAPIAVSSSPAKRQRCVYNLRSSSKKAYQSAERIPAVTPKKIAFERETEVYDIYNSPQMKHEEPSMVWSSLHFASYGAAYLQHQRKKEERECKELFGTVGPYPPSAVEEIYTLDALEWRYLGDEDNASLDQERYQYRQRIVALKEVIPLDVATLLPRQPLITASMRAILVNWLAEVANEYSVSSAAFHLGVSLLDAFLAKGRPEPDSYDEDGIVSRNEFQGLGCACLWIASKMEDKTPPEIDDLIYISDHSFDQVKLVELEQRICKTLNFCLHRVTPHHYVDTFLRASQAGDPPHPTLLVIVEYLLELSRLSFDISYRPPSLVAAATLYLARATLGILYKDESYWSPTLVDVTQYSVEDIQDTVLVLHKYQLISSESKELTAIFNKYRNHVSHKVALKVAPRFDSLAIDFDICNRVEYEYTMILRDF